PGVRRVDHLRHDRRVRRDRSAAQVVAVAEAAWQHDRVDALQLVVAMPQRDGLGAREPHGALRVAVVKRAGEGDDADARGHQATFTATTSSMTWFERNSSASRWASASTASVTSPSTVSSK